jgi:hypothetical protein
MGERALEARLYPGILEDGAHQDTCGLENQQVEECVIRGRDRTAETRLPRPPFLAADQMFRLFEQIVV